MYSQLNFYTGCFRGDYITINDFFDLFQLDAPAPTWEQLDKGLVAVKTVVHGLVDFIQNHSKKAGDPQQVCKSVRILTAYSKSYCVCMLLACLLFFMFVFCIF